MNDFEDDAPAVQKLPAEQLSAVSLLAQQLTILEAQKEVQEENLQRLKGQLRLLVEERLPDAMALLGLESLTLEDGSRVNISTDYHAGIPANREGEAFRWLRDRNYESLIKNEVKAMFGKGEDQLAAQLITFANANGIDFKSKQAIHPQTLKAFVREKAEAGTPVPEDLFGVYVQKRAQLTRR